MKLKFFCLALALVACFATVRLSSAATSESVRVVSADLQQTNGALNTMFKRCVGAGRANEGLRADHDGGVQAMVWDFNNTFPRSNMINRVFCKRDLPSRPKNKVTLSLTHPAKANPARSNVFPWTRCPPSCPTCATARFNFCLRNNPMNGAFGSLCRIIIKWKQDHAHKIACPKNL